MFRSYQIDLGLIPEKEDGIRVALGCENRDPKEELQEMDIQTVLN